MRVAKEPFKNPFPHVAPPCATCTCSLTDIETLEEQLKKNDEGIVGVLTELGQLVQRDVSEKASWVPSYCRICWIAEAGERAGKALAEASLFFLSFLWGSPYWYTEKQGV